MAHPGELVGEPSGRHPAVGVDEFDQDLGDADIGARGQHALLLDGVARAHDVAGPHRPSPAHLVDARRAQRGDAAEEAVGQQAHHDGAGVPARGDEATDGRGLRGLRVGVHRLGIEGAAEGDDLLGRYRLAAERVGLADGEVLVMQLVAVWHPLLHAAALWFVVFWWFCAGPPYRLNPGLSAAAGQAT
jgi:hypothetical protein